jgi:hypothetical protein
LFVFSLSLHSDGVFHANTTFSLFVEESIATICNAALGVDRQLTWNKIKERIQELSELRDNKSNSGNLPAQVNEKILNDWLLQVRLYNFVLIRF